LSESNEKMRNIKLESILAAVAKGGSPAATASVEAFLNALPGDAALPSSAMYHSGDDEALLTWRSEDDFIEVGLPGDGTISWYSRISGNKSFRDELFDNGNVVLDARLVGDIVAFSKRLGQ
jgi:hypothetical protein